MVTTNAIPRPEYPAVDEYPSEARFASELTAARELFEAELAQEEGWEDKGEKEGVHLYSKTNPDDPNGVPTVKGVCVVKDCTSEEYLATIQLPGMRKRWDLRFESGRNLASFSRLTYEFYSEMKGFGWIVSPRDLVGVQKTYRQAGLQQEIRVIQTSVRDENVAPNQPKKVRATLKVSGWQLKPQGADLEVTYIVHISLNGSLPGAVVRQIASEIPMCTGRARDVYQKVGHAPYVYFGPDDVETGTIFHNESITEQFEYHLVFKPAAGSCFDIRYDARRMYSGKKVSADVPPESGVSLVDDGQGVLRVNCEKDSAAITITVKPV